MKGLLSIFKGGSAPADGSAPWVPAELPPLPAPAAQAAPPMIARPPVESAPWVPGALPAVPVRRKRLVFGFDATASRSDEWEAAKRLTDSLFTALPGQLDVALAVHGGDKLHTFTGFTAEPGKLRDKAAGVRCRAGFTRLLDILGRVTSLDDVTLLYIGDSFEEDETKARKLAATLGRRGSRVIILQDGTDENARKVFREIAELSGGALLSFDMSAVKRLRELFAAVAVVAVGGTELLETKKATMPAATLLLAHLDTKRIGGR
jgi:hypothetical protein